MAQYTDYTEKTEPVDTDLALIYDTPAKVNKKFTFGNLWKWIAKKIVSEGISQLETTNKTIPGAINELNSKIIHGKLQPNKTSVIQFERSRGCLLFMYHPYFGHGLYAFTAWDESTNTNIQQILSLNDVTTALTGVQLSITSSKNYNYTILQFDFYTN